MTFTVDYSTDEGKVRLLISDTDEDNPIFDDAAISAFLAMALGNHVKRAAAQALLAIATSEVLVQKRIRILDLQTDGPAEAAALRQVAADFNAQADSEESAADDGAFDWAEMVTTESNLSEKIWKEGLRS